MNVIKTVLSNLSTQPEQPVVLEVHGSELRPCSRADFQELVSRARSFLEQTGVERGDRVGLLAPNSTRWAALDIALLSHGAISVPLYSRQNPAELAGMLQDCGATLLIAATSELAEGVRENWDTCCDTAHFETVFQSEISTTPPVELKPEEAVTIIYTSGTSGEPKGVITTRANMDFMVPTTAAALDRLLGRKDAEEHPFHYLPFCFAGSRIVLWTQLARGIPLMVSTDLNNLPEELGTARPQYMLNVPALLERIRRKVEEGVAAKGGIGLGLYRGAFAALARQRKGKKHFLDGLRISLANRMVFSKIKEKIGPRLDFLICGSAPLNPDTQRWYETLGIPVYQVYGLTETTAIVTMDRPPEVEAGTVGPSIDGIEIQLSEEGELLTRGPHIFGGYWGREAASAEALLGGWFHSGDQAIQDDKGNYRIIGRVKNVLVPESGHNVAPEPLEHALLAACPDLDQAIAIGHGRHHLIVLVHGVASDSQITKSLDQINSALPHYRHLRSFIRATEPFSDENGLLTANQKMKRKAIEAAYANAIEEAYA